MRRDVTAGGAWLAAVNLLKAAQAPGLAGLRVRLWANLAGESADHPSVDWTTDDTVTWRGSARFVTDLRAFVDAQEALVAALAPS